MTVADPAQCPLDDPIVGVILRACLILLSGETKQNDRRNSVRPDGIHLPVEHLVHRQLKYTGHGRNFPRRPLSVNHEDRLDEVGGRQLVLAHQLPQHGRAAPASGPVSRRRREGHLRRLESEKPARNGKQCKSLQLARALPSLAPEPVFRLQRLDPGGLTVGKRPAAHPPA